MRQRRERPHEDDQGEHQHHQWPPRSLQPASWASSTTAAELGPGPSPFSCSASNPLASPLAVVALPRRECQAVDHLANRPDYVLHSFQSRKSRDDTILHLCREVKLLVTHLPLRDK